MSRLYIMMGVPGAGKTTFINEHMNSTVDKHISRDHVRFSMVSEDEEYFSKEKEVFKEYIRRINEALAQGYDVFADATHLNRASRNKLIRVIEPGLSSKPDIDVIWIKKDLQTCLAQNENRKGTRSYVPKSVIRRMFYSIEKPEFEEGFDTIFIVEDDKPIQMLKKMEDLKDDVSAN